jgi:hypothetical protein
MTPHKMAGILVKAEGRGEDEILDLFMKHWPEATFDQFKHTIEIAMFPLREEANRSQREITLMKAVAEAVADVPDSDTPIIYEKLKTKASRGDLEAQRLLVEWDEAFPDGVMFL